MPKYLEIEVFVSSMIPVKTLTYVSWFLQTGRPRYLDFYYFKIWIKKTLNSFNYFMFLYIQVLINKKDNNKKYK